MAKTLRIAIPLILSALFLAGCPKRQSPTPADTVMGGPGFNDSDVIADEGLGSFGGGFEDTGLELRGGEGLYNGRETVRGVLPSIYFGFDQSSIEASERGKAQQAADYLANNPSEDLLIEGHCDWYGTAEYNLALGDRRATSVYNYMTTLGVDPGRIEVLSKGSLEAVSGLSKTESAQDRRADFVILLPKQ